MTSAFAGIGIATRGLYTSQAGLLVTSNNISNVSTTGYSRQVVNQSAVGPAAAYSSSGIIGGGSQVNSIDRVRNLRLDEKYWRENTSLGQWGAKSTALTEIESVLGEPSDNGFSTVMEDFTAALEDLSTNPSDTSVRTSVRQTAVAFCEYLNETAQRLSQLRNEANQDVQTTVTEINSYCKQIAELNDKIRLAAASGASTNEMEDQRGLLIDKLSELVDIDVNQTAAGTNSTAVIWSISVNGKALVNGGKAEQLECYQITDGSTQNGMYGIRWASTGDDFTAAGGALKAYLDLRDGTGTDGEYQGIPYYIDQLDKFAQTFAKAVNEGTFADGTDYYSGHADGLGADGSTTGVRFFSYDGISSDELMASGADMDEIYGNITAANISLSFDILDNLDNIAAASTDGGSENNENVDAIISLLQDSKMFNKGTPEDFMNAIIATLGTNSSYAQRMNDSQSKIVKNADDRRTSVSGVSTNEETVNLTVYEQAYEASAKMMSVWSSIYEETIDLISY